VSEERERESLKEETRTAVEEARMVLPGIQALFGFQLIAVFNQRFQDLPRAAQITHLLALGLVTLTIALVMAPAAYHRIAERGWASRHLVDLTSLFLSWGMGMLMIALSLEVPVVAQLLLHNVAFSVFVGAALLLVFLSLWFVLPLRARARGSRRGFG
jgi:heme A synthase